MIIILFILAMCLHGMSSGMRYITQHLKDKIPSSSRYKVKLYFKMQRYTKVIFTVYNVKQLVNFGHWFYLPESLTFLSLYV